MKLTSFLHMDHYKTAVGRLRGLYLDYGDAFTRELVTEGDFCTLQIKSCLYHRIFSEEHVPHLTRCCCCSQDRIWLEKSELRNISSGLASSIADGQDVCCYYVRRLPKGGIPTSTTLH